MFDEGHKNRDAYTDPTETARQECHFIRMCKFQSEYTQNET